MKKAFIWSAPICALVTGLALAVPGTAKASVTRPAAPSAYTTFPGRLYSTVAVSSRDVWAVGLSPGGSLIVHWNGASWSQSLAGLGFLTGVADSSARDVWAVGGTNWFSPTQTLAENWNGSSWAIVGTPDPPGGGYFNAVAATSPRNAWAVGLAGPGPGDPSPTTPLIEHWNGKTWTRMPSPNPLGSSDSVLQAVTAVSSGNVWAVGYDTIGGYSKTLAMHWDGRHWSVLPSPTPLGNGSFQSVAASWTNNIWATGITSPAPSGPHFQTLIAHWNGTSWR